MGQLFGGFSGLDSGQGACDALRIQASDFTKQHVTGLCRQVEGVTQGQAIGQCDLDLVWIAARGPACLDIFQGNAIDLVQTPQLPPQIQQCGLRVIGRRLGSPHQHAQLQVAETQRHTVLTGQVLGDLIQ
ncbi:hypothetical protein D3C84_719710 [compost metagenome]